jgi:lipopolysaccharide/colanic/teichoic acid biosynthesis glycosyltransferase
MDRPTRIAKRAMDLALASIGLVLSAPLLALIALGVRLTSRGPVFYGQLRAGTIQDVRADPVADAPTFMLYKFRSMLWGAEERTGVVLAARNDPRVTRLGRLLRRSRLDELPQLWNVLKGEMSIVGPRPERPEMLRLLAQAIPYFEERMRLVKPGITGLAQVELDYTGQMPPDSILRPYADQLLNPFELEAARGSLADDMRIKLLYDLAYSARLENFRSFLKTDLSILARTPRVMIKGLGR